MLKKLFGINRLVEELSQQYYLHWRVFDFSGSNSKEKANDDDDKFKSAFIHSKQPLFQFTRQAIIKRVIIGGEQKTFQVNAQQPQMIQLLIHLLFFFFFPSCS